MQTPAPFTYERATSVDGAIASLVKHDGEARIIAGGHSLLPMMKLRLAQPEHLIDINDLGELSYIREFADEIRIGALTRHVELLHSDVLARRLPIFADAERVIADPVIHTAAEAAAIAQSPARRSTFSWAELKLPPGLSGTRTSVSISPSPTAVT